jgi:AcrR family transcriptional regulator
MPKVTEAHLEARRSQILDAAWTCFARKGYHQATMQDICKESGLSPGAIYRYSAKKRSPAINAQPGGGPGGGGGGIAARGRAAGRRIIGG